ncbi:MAG: M4 family metallopeptidase [Crocinitomix sp.]|nr:M4 family metallopeptidase [Crocinitomix sp.]
MKTNKLLIGILLLIGINSAYAQLATLPVTICESYKEAGWIFFKPESINTGELFTDHYASFFTDANNTMVVDRNWNDNWLNLGHKHYTQYYNGIRVEGRGFTEHYRNSGELLYANGKICSEIGKKFTSNIISEHAAIDSILAKYVYNQLSWDSPAFEEQYKADLEDTLATSYPTGELLFTTKDWKVPIKYDQSANDYVLAWKFEITCLLPSFHVGVYVDALTGDVIKIIDMVHHDGPAIIPFYGMQTLDTRWEGWPTNAHVLHTDNSGRNVHTKYDGPLSWGLTEEVQDSDGDWGTSEQEATAAHWAVAKTWDYFKNKHGRNGLDGSGSKLRVLAGSDDRVGAWYDKIAGIDRVFAGWDEDDIYHGEISVLAHEFTHGVDEHSGKLDYFNEPGALDESFADIFGYLVRQYATGSSSWEIGVPTASDRGRRSLQFPKTLGIHYVISEDSITFTESIGQPDTYGGENWFPWDLFGSDQGGVHINSGVQNHWFYMLCNGEIDVNDNEDSYVVFGIGAEKAAKIAYYNLTSHMGENSQYEDAMIGAIHAAALAWGECSFEHVQTQNAWYAAGVGDWSYCYGAGIAEHESTFTMYPNPAQEFTNLRFETHEPKTIQIYTSNGVLLKTIRNITSQSYLLDISYLASGSYFVAVVGNKNQATVLIKN